YRERSDRPGIPQTRSRRPRSTHGRKRSPLTSGQVAVWDDTTTIRPKARHVLGAVTHSEDTMGILPHAELVKLHGAIVSAGLVESRDALLTGIDTSFVATLPRDATPSAQILRDIGILNNAGTLTDGTLPLSIWLLNAVALVGGRAESEIFRAAIE